MPDASQLAHEAAHRVARESYGKLVAFLAKRTRDVAGAEDALSEAFAAALVDWPRKGIPINPEAWLMAVAKRKTIDVSRRARSSAAASDHLQFLAEEIEAMATREAHIPDERLSLMFACAHPALDPAIRTPLILQTVLGLDAADIGSAFLVTPAAMGQRLARAKQKIKLAGIPLRVPEPNELGDRLDGVLEAIYAAYGQGWSETSALTEEAIWLARVTVSLLPDEAEGLGLLALMLFLQSRKNARQNSNGDYVPLSDQNVHLWNDGEINEAESLLHRASALSAVGRFQLEAAIQSAHTTRRVTGKTDWQAIRQLYDGLYNLTGSFVVAINRAVAVAEVEGPIAGLAALPVKAAHPQLAGYQPYHAVRAELLARSGALHDAIAAYELAIGLAADGTVRKFLQAKRAALVTVN